LKALLVAGLAAAGGVLTLAILFPRVDPAAKTPMAADRSQDIERVRQLASRYGVNTAGWRAVVTDQTDPKFDYYLEKYPDDPAAKLFGMLRMTVTLLDPNSRQSIQAILFQDGRLAQWKWDRPPAQPHPSPPPATILTDFVGSTPGKLTEGNLPDEDILKYDWQWKAADRFPLRATLEIQQKAGALISAVLTPAYDDHFEKEYKKSQKSPIRIIGFGTGVVVWGLGLVLCIWQTVRGRMRWPIPIVLFGAQVIWVAISFWAGTYYQEYVGRRQSGIDELFLMIGENSAVFWSFFWLPVLAGAGSAIRSAGNREKWHSLAEIARGRRLNRASAESLAAGLLSGIGLAAVPYLVAALRWLPNDVLEFRSIDALVAPAPGLMALRLSAAVPALALFGFLFPFLRHLRKEFWFWTAFAPVSILVLTDSMPFHTPAPSLASAILIFIAWLLIYRRFDLLAVLVTAVTARAAVVPCLLLSEPVSSLRVSAIGILTVGGAAIAASVYWAVRGPEAQTRPESSVSGVSPDADLPAKSDRERLQAEFEVARKAQQDALPEEPPKLERYTLAGWCEPAQQVGGDLYDFFPLPDGRLGIAVADVSGKGVPAALYMMVTKGLLTAVSRESNQLLYILEQVNLHLYRACRRKVFVTMAAVVLDHVTGRLEYGRAGHNPVVWRRTRKGETKLLKPPGLGLGMTPGERFTRTLRIEEYDLEPDDAIVLYSDGVTEAIDAGMDQFGEERLMRAVERTDGQSAIDSRDAILRELRGFMGAVPARDDITLVVIRA